jgi:hypothetical protein
MMLINSLGLSPPSIILWMLLAFKWRWEIRESELEKLLNDV